MKKKFLVVSLFLLFIHGYGQSFDYGFKAGINYSKLLWEEDLFDTKRKILFSGGLQSRINWNSNLGTKVEFLFSQAGSNFNQTNDYIILNRIALPVLLTYKVQKLYLAIGGEMSIIHGRRCNSQGNPSELVDNNDYGVLIGIEYMINEKFSTDLRYYHGLLYHNEIALFDEFANQIGSIKTDKISLFTFSINYYLKKG